MGSNPVKSAHKRIKYSGHQEVPRQEGEREGEEGRRDVGRRKGKEGRKEGTRKRETKREGD